MTYDIFAYFAHTKFMEAPILLSALYLLILAMLSKEKFAILALTFSAAFCVVSVELLSGINGLTICFCLAICLLRMPRIRISLIDALLWAFVTATLVFWMSTSEFMDGFAYSYIMLSIALALICNILFKKENRQTLYASAILSAFAILLVCNRIFYVTDVAITLVISIALTEKYVKRNEKFLLRSLN